MTTDVIEPLQPLDTWPDWASWITVVEFEFHHVMRDPDAPQDAERAGPRPDQLSERLNLPVTAVTSNGLLLWLPDGSVVHGDWSADAQTFLRRDGKSNLALTDVRAWSALPTPIATA